MRARLGVHGLLGGWDILTMCCGCPAWSLQWSHFIIAQLGPLLCPHAVRGTHSQRLARAGVLRCPSRFHSVLASH